MSPNPIANPSMSKPICLLCLYFLLCGGVCNDGEICLRMERDSASQQAKAFAIEQGSLLQVSRGSIADLGADDKAETSKDTDADFRKAPRSDRLLYVGIMSAPAHVDRRNKCRDAFLTKLRSRYPDHKVRAEFIIGHSGAYMMMPHQQGAHAKHAELEQALHDEAKKHGDIMRIPLKESYETLPDKTLQFLSLGLDRQYGFLLKMDDDILLNIKRTVNFFEGLDPMTPIYAGEYLWSEENLWTQRGRDNKFFPYYSGHDYAVSWQLAKQIETKHRTHSEEYMLYGSSSEDVDMGHWVQFEAKKGTHIEFKTFQFADRGGSLQAR
eukprot:gnl/TRDRNA2_/TRDRNA2_132840_c1_seq1.p1 gnl/TRDRNA2_/TRDRNA2_132840_c1~~gnl/TRDRNA2_/TRDRNA2_132840_c1_seq1.p1  ORF type:complete len:324 (-),score=46.63 gnl/TRDRNA2_/TRDRNA2_132840_c1_seq1:54-1025(-)